jgi:hypothetical protein
MVGKKCHAESFMVWWIFDGFLTYDRFLWYFSWDHRCQLAWRPQWVGDWKPSFSPNMGRTTMISVTVQECPPCGVSPSGAIEEFRCIAFETRHVTGDVSFV